MIDNLNDSFKEIITTSPIAYHKEYEDLLFVLCNEFHWTQEDIWNTDIPFIFNLLNARSRFNKEQEKQLNKKR